MKRAIRRRTGYGCIFCGKPFWEYHHIFGYREEVGHVEKEITLLCSDHHRKERNKLIPRSMVIEADGNPVNIRQGHTSPDRIWYSDKPSSIALGGIEVQGVRGIRTDVLLLDDLPVIQLREEDNNWLLSLDLKDPWHRSYLKIVDNELSMLVPTEGDTDIDYEGGLLTIRAERGLIIFQAKFASPRLIVSHGTFHHNGIYAVVKPGVFSVANPGGPRYSNFTVAWTSVGVAVGRMNPNRGASIRISAPIRLLPKEACEEGFREIPESEIDY